MKFTKYRVLFLLSYILLNAAGPVAGQPSAPPAHPFPQHVTYHKGCIIPDHLDRQQLDNSVRSFYDQWKKKYIRRGCSAGEYYVWFESLDHHKQCVSEGQGYGMLITVLMAGHDPSARQTFDGLYRYARSHPSKTNPYLMAWAQKKDCRSIDGSSATDGDMDIAYSLVLADAQWGSKGDRDPINYRGEARYMIAAILAQEINQRSFTVLLSNDVEHDSKDYFDMRSSDFMPAHFRAFYTLSGDTGWEKTIDNNYRLFAYLQDTYSPGAGLVPDFITKIGFSGSGPSLTCHAVPAKPNYLESRSDGLYNFNACRMPWRIATDYILNGDDRALALLGKVNSWIRRTTRDNPDNISAGYNLGGEDLTNRYYEAMCFIAPFAVSAMISHNNQTWLNSCWDYMVNFSPDQFDYYDNSIKMIDMILLSGNYWAP